MSILVVGGGTSGFISAMILKKFLDSKVSIVYSKDIGTVGVGEGSTEHFKEFIDFVGIEEIDLIKECDATYKTGIMFKNWSERDYLHSVWHPYSNTSAQYPYIYSNLIIQNKTLHPSYLFENKIPSLFLNSGKFSNQYHFNTFKLNSFLHKKAKEMGIDIIEDEIMDVNLNEYGEIESLVGKNTTYSYDFYIDSTGFKRKIIGKLNPEWESFSEHLKMNSAVVFETKDEEEYSLWTLAKSMNNGWRFKIPSYGKIGNGYIYNDSFCSENEIKKEIDEELGFDVEISKSFKFDPGYIKNPWIKNCVAIGLSGSFVEPLEATSIGTSIQQSFLLMQRILNYSNEDIHSYNKEFCKIMNNIRDFILLHYFVKRQDTDFWKSIQNVEIPESLHEKINKFINRIPIREDFSEESNYCLFGNLNYILVMNGLNLFNTDHIKNEFFMLNKNIRDESDILIDNEKNIEDSYTYIGHKKFIEICRNFS